MTTKKEPLLRGSAWENKRQTKPCQVVSMNKMTGLCVFFMQYIVVLKRLYHDVVICNLALSQRFYRPLSGRYFSGQAPSLAWPVDQNLGQENPPVRFQPTPKDTD